MDDENELDEMEELLGAAEPGRRPEFRIRNLLEYAQLLIYSFCRLQYFLRAVRTRVSDRDYEFNAGRGGETDYIEAPIGEPDTIDVDESFIVTGFVIGRVGLARMVETLKKFGAAHFKAAPNWWLEKLAWFEDTSFDPPKDKSQDQSDENADKNDNSDSESEEDSEDDEEEDEDSGEGQGKKVKAKAKKAPKIRPLEEDERRKLFDLYYRVELTEQEFDALLNKQSRSVGRIKYFTFSDKQDDGSFKQKSRYFLEALDQYGELQTHYLTNIRQQHVVACDLWDPEILGACSTLLPDEDPSKIEVVGPEELEKKIKELGEAAEKNPEAAEKLLDAHITAEKKAKHKIRFQFKSGSMFLLTPELSDTTSQLFRGPWNMMWKGLVLRLIHRNVIRQKRNPFLLVPYPKVGCSPKGPKRDEKAEYYWRDARYRKAILLKSKPNRVNKKDKRSNLPAGLYYSKEHNDYRVQNGSLDPDGIIKLSHNEAESKCSDAKDVYTFWLVSLVTEAMGTKDPYKWSLVARYGEAGLRTASEWMIDELTDDRKVNGEYVNFWYAGDRFKAEWELEAAVAHRDYDNLKAEMEATGVKFWKEDADFETNFPGWADQANDFVDARFDRSYPSEQYKLRSRLSKLYGAHNKKSLKSKAKVLQALTKRSMHIISMPRVRWVWIPDARGGGRWQLSIDWSTFDYFAEGVEAMRDWIRKLAEWKYSKNANRVMASMKFDDKTAMALANQDWGGIWNPIESRHDLCFWLLYCYAQKHAPCPELFEDVPYPKRKKGESKDDWVVRYTQFWHRVEARVAIMGWAWYDRHPNDEMPHDGALRVLTAQKWADWIEMILTARKLNTLQGEGLIPDLDDLLKDYTSRQRNYYNESVWMESDEGATRDPQAVWGYMRGILRPNIISILNYRYAGAYRDCPDIRLKYTDIHSETATKLRDQVKEMWKNASVRELTVRISKIWADAQADNVIHIRPLYIKVLHGLPKGVLNNPEFHKFIQGLNKRSDERVEFWAAQLSNGGGTWTGKRALTPGFVDRVIGEGYGTGRGLTSKQTQQLQDKLGFMAWMNQQYDKAIALTRGLVFNAKAAENVMEEQYKSIASAIAGGMYPPVVRNVMVALSESKIIQIKYFFPDDDEDVLKPVERVEAHFKEEEISRIGPRMVEAVEKGTLFDELAAA